MENNCVLRAIYSRRSVREFSEGDIGDDTLREIIKAGSYAPSGLNNQPWRFVIIRDTGLKNDISTLTHYSKIVVGARVLIAVMLDLSAVYNREKDIQAIGACTQNMLLAIHSLGLGAVWLGEILKKKVEFNGLLELEDRYELMAVIAMGRKPDKELSSGRKSIDELIIKEEA